MKQRNGMPGRREKTMKIRGNRNSKRKEKKNKTRRNNKNKKEKTVDEHVDGTSSSVGEFSLSHVIALLLVKLW